MRNKVFVFVFGAILLALVGFILSETFEIYPVKKTRGYSPHAAANPYLALERWLRDTGHPVRVETVAGNAFARFSPSKEKVACVQALRLDWKKEERERILAWVEEGGHLVVYLTGDATRAPQAGGDELEEFLQALGIQRVYDSPVKSSGAAGYPYFSGPLAFKPVEESPRRPAMTLRKDARGLIRLIIVPVEKGSVTVCGLPRFMRSGALRSEENALLSWQLTGERDPEKNGVLFIRGREEREGLYASLALRGALVFPILSALILVVVGFWMAIPVFGRWKTEVSRPGRSIGERFLAEGLFLKRFRALENYLAAYIQEIRLKLRGGTSGFVTKAAVSQNAQGIEAEIPQAGISQKSPAEELERKARSPQRGDAPKINPVFGPELSAPYLAARCGLDKREVEKALAPGAHIKFREFLRYRKILETILERL